MREQLSPAELRNKHIKVTITIFSILLILIVSAIVFAVSSI
ncbi:hypothetical protein ACJDU8_04915 [Clostridium sp. WILCCON 0269]|uniref:Uncharacterized protein n=1 Tax=Candidatus Clostridium eludens TaxID=3381663 RepID=A0ABW8SI55_9CLOT